MGDRARPPQTRKTNKSTRAYLAFWESKVSSLTHCFARDTLHAPERVTNEARLPAVVCDKDQRPSMYWPCAQALSGVIWPLCPLWEMQDSCSSWAYLHCFFVGGVDFFTVYVVFGERRAKTAPAEHILNVF